MGFFRDVLNMVLSDELEESTKTEYSKWWTAYFCVNCNYEMSDYEMMCSSGRCKECGYKGPSAVTVVDCYEKAKRKVTSWSGPNKKVEYEYK